MQTSKYQIFQGEDSQIRFRLKSRACETLLLSEAYRSKTGAVRGIASAMQYTQNDRFYSRRLSSNYKYYFVLKSKDGRILGTSEMFESKQCRDNAIIAVKRAARSARVDDLI